MCKIIAIANQKGGVAKTTTTINLGVGLSKVGKRVMLIDADPQGHLTMGLGFPKNLRVTLKTMMENIIMGLEFDPREAILHHEEGIDVMGITYVVFANTDAYTKEIDKRIPFRNNILHNGIVEYGTDDIHSAYELLVEFISMLVFIKKQLINEKTK